MSLHHNAIVPFLIAIMVGSAGLARADDAAEDKAFQTQLFGRTVDRESAFACFTRTYDPGHLASHPHQNVRTMKLLVAGRAGSDTPSYGLRMDVTFRKSREHFTTGGSCGSLHDQSSPSDLKPTVHCGVDCDGGNIDVSLRDAKSVLVGIPAGARISSNRDADELVDHSKRFGSDDKVFRLDRAKVSECLGLADDADKPAMRRMK